jgi:hypothetical protein
MDILYGKDYDGWSEEDIEGHKHWSSNPTAFEFWYPKVEGLAPTPKSAVFRISPSALWQMIEPVAENKRHEQEYKEVADAISGFSNVIGVPFFLKRGNFSAKHSWKDACFVDSSDTENIIRHMVEIATDAELCDCAPEYCFVARALIPTKCAFKAFWGKMPVTKERRYFIRDGQVEFHHPYWPPDSIETEYDLHTDEPNWKALLAEVNRETPEEVEHLSQQSRKVASVLPGY